LTKLKRLPQEARDRVVSLMGLFKLPVVFQDKVDWGSADGGAGEALRKIRLPFNRTNLDPASVLKVVATLHGDDPAKWPYFLANKPEFEAVERFAYIDARSSSLLMLFKMTVQAKKSTQDGQSHSR
jgi:hypothetical protein